MIQLFDGIKYEFNEKTNITLEVRRSGPKIAAKNLEKQLIDAAISIWNVKQWVRFLRSLKIYTLHKHLLEVEEVGKMSFYFYASRTSGIKKASIDDLTDAYLGKKTRCKELGGSTGNIKLYHSKTLLGALRLLRLNFLNKVHPVNIKMVDSFDDLKNTLSNEPCALTFAAGGFLSKDFIVETRNIERPITLATYGQPSKKVLTLINFLKNKDNH